MHARVQVLEGKTDCKKDNGVTFCAVLTERTDKCRGSVQVGDTLVLR